VRRTEQVLFFVRPYDRPEEPQKEPAQTTITESKKIDRDRSKSSKYEAKQGRRVRHEVHPYRNHDHAEMEGLARELTPHRHGRMRGIGIEGRRLHGRAMLARCQEVGKQKIPGLAAEKIRPLSVAYC
jgi:hypothetical protein